MQAIWDQIVNSVGGYLPTILGAVAIMVIGWLVAMVLSAVVAGGLRRTGLNTKLASWFAVGDDEKGPDIARGVARGVFWLVILLTLVAVFQALNLSLVTVPLSGLLNQVFEFAPKLFGAGILLLLAWVIASVSRLITVRVLDAAKVDERLGKEQGTETEKSIPLTRTIGDGIYWLVFLLFLPAILGALSLEGLLAPVQGMMDKLLGYLPNIFAATLIGVIGWFVARIVQRVVTNLIAAAGGDRLSEKVGFMSVSKVAGLIVYVLMLLPVFIAALNALALDAITTPASSMLNLILEAIPSIFAAAVVLTIAYVVGRMLSGLIASIMTRLGFNSILVKLGIGKEPVEGQRTPSEVLGYLVMVGIMLFAIFEASSLLGFNLLSNLLMEMTQFGGQLLMGIIILSIGLYLARLASAAIKGSNMQQKDLIATLSRVAILLLVGSIAIRQMGLANEIINLAFGLILGAIAVAAAIAFGIGGRDIAARKLQEWSTARGTATLSKQETS